MDREPLKLTHAPAIPGYRIEGVLGRGATGVVYRALQISVDRPVALKVLHPELVGAKSATRRLQREARATARLSHPNIISAIDMGQVDGVWWYAMELVDGVSLHHRVKDRALSEREALRLFIPIVEALQHAFERGVVHRDIKPSNILVESGNARALLVDLGLAYASDDPQLTKSGATLGTPHYISPEQARDPATADAQSDLWSLGATLYHAVCGRPPFAGESVAEILSAVLYAPIPDPRELAPQISKGFALVVRKLLTRDRARRYQTPAELLADLERLRERRAPRVREGALDPTAGAGRRRVRTLLAALAGAAVVSAGAWMASRLADRAEDDAHSTGAQLADPLDALERARSGEARQLCSALRRARELEGSVPPGSRERLDELIRGLEARIDSEFARFRAEGEARLRRELERGEFDAAELTSTIDLARDLSAHLGPPPWPQRIDAQMTGWLAELSDRVRAARTRAEASFARALEERWSARIAPQIDAFEKRNAWQSARSLLTTGLRAWIDAADLPRRGLSSESVERAIATLVRTHVDPRREALDAAYEALDRELVRWIDTKAAELADLLASRRIDSARTELENAWAAELGARSLAIEELPAGLLHRSLEALARHARELDDAARLYADKDARLALGEIERDTRSLWTARRFGAAGRAFEAVRGQPLFAPLADEIASRARTGAELEELLVDASKWIADNEGRTLALRLGSIPITGRLAAVGEPLEKGFQLALDGGRVLALSLRREGGAGAPTALADEDLERLSALGARLNGAAFDPARHRLRCVLLRLESGDYEGARAHLDAGQLPAGDPLVASAEGRVREALRHANEALGERRVAALDQLHVVRRLVRARSPSANVVQRIEALLAEYGDALTPDEAGELRRARDERLAKSAPAPAPARASLSATAIDEVAPGRVRLRYEFRGERTGSFERGEWMVDGSGWSPVATEASDATLVARTGPHLALGRGFRVHGEPLDVYLRIVQLPDSQPNVLSVSVAGFHAVFAGASERLPARVHVDTGELADVVAKARAGEGREFSGWKIGDLVELRFLVQRARGTIAIEVGGKRVAELVRSVPRGNPDDAALTIRAFEPVRLVSATVEGTKR